LNVESVRAIWENVGAGAPRHCLAACLMTDAERYTSLTETMEPSAVVEVINRYFGALFGPVLANGGTVSDVKGDGLLAVWNHESAGAQFKARVCRACVEIVAEVDRLNKEWPAHRLPTRLGVDFGPVALARVGAHARYEYRAVGDPVNTASRLQELNKLFKTLQDAHPGFGRVRRRRQRLPVPRSRLLPAARQAQPHADPGAARRAGRLRRPPGDPVPRVRARGRGLRDRRHGRGPGTFPGAAGASSR
jgi:hypothetical protein